MTVHEILKFYKRIAIIGISANTKRPSNWIARYFIEYGYEVTGINPGLPKIEGIKVLAFIEQIPEPLEIVNIFRAREHVPSLVEELLPLKPKVIWLQEGAENPVAEKVARDHGIIVVSGKCIYREHSSLTK